LPGLKRYLVIMFLFTFCFTAYPAVWPYYGKAQFGWDGWWNGMSLAAFGICMALVQGLLVAPSVKLWGEKMAAVYGMIMHVITFGYYSVIQSSFWALAFTPISALGDIAGPAMQGTMSKLTPEDQQGELQGVISSVSSVAATVSPLMMTLIFAHYTDKTGIQWAGAPFLFAGALMVAAVLILVAAPADRKAQVAE
jgi:MFS transporter, DHA1 family, tetracycline resistance protein